jgi:2-succinyl-6-hydroxy-2,4-cyclohexadiene-1-carboxylate synthase
MLCRVAATLVLLHGFTHTGASWDPVRATLPGRYRVVAPDIRGHGSASAREPVSLDAVIDDVATSLREPAVLAGYSMGGRIALHVALAHPRNVSRLVLIGASPGVADGPARDERRAADDGLAARVEGMTIAEFAAEWAGGTTVLAGQPPVVLAAVQADRLRNTPAGLARALRGLGTGALPPLWERLGELAAPVSLIVGERDAKFRSIAEEMAPRFGGGAEVSIVQGVGHAVHLEAPGRVGEILVPGR